MLIIRVIYVYFVVITDPIFLPVHNSPAAIMFTIAVFSREDTALVNIRRLFAIFRKNQSKITSSINIRTAENIADKKYIFPFLF